MIKYNILELVAAKDEGPAPSAPGDHHAKLFDLVYGRAPRKEEAEKLTHALPAHPAKD
jgi:hypothetical protein